MRNLTIACVIGATTLAGGALFADQASAQDIACGDAYVVSRGDTLQRITTRAYGPDKSYQLLYSANRATIGRNPSLIEIGQRLTIPCLDAAAASTARTDTVTKSAETEPSSEAVQVTATAIATPATTGRVRMMTGTDWAPFSNQNQEQGGMITEIVNVAAAVSLAEEGYKIDFINDWSAHIQPLISDGAYDFTFPWFRPNCDVKERLGPGSQFRCDNLAWSDPLFEQIIGYYARAGDASPPETHAELAGSTICRPAGYAMFMLEEHGLVEPTVAIERPSSPLSCFEMLAAGDVDFVVIATMVGDDAIANLADPTIVAEQPQLATVATLHAVTSISNPNKDAQIAALNEGIRTTRESGKWFEIVQRHLIDHARKTSSN